MKGYCRDNNCYLSIILRVTKIHLNLKGIAAKSSTRKACKILEEITIQEYTKAFSLCVTTVFDLYLMHIKVQFLFQQGCNKI